MVTRERPDVVLLDVWMPVMDGFQVLERLREDAATRDVPVILLTAMPPAEGEASGNRLGVRHYLAKPFDPGLIVPAVKVALREAGQLSDENSEGHAEAVWRGGQRDDGGGPLSKGVVTSGNMQLDQKLNGGIRPGSLTLIEGTSKSGKSVACQHFAYESLKRG